MRASCSSLDETSSGWDRWIVQRVRELDLKDWWWVPKPDAHSQGVLLESHNQEGRFPRNWKSFDRAFKQSWSRRDLKPNEWAQISSSIKDDKTLKRWIRSSAARDLRNESSLGRHQSKTREAGQVSWLQGIVRSTWNFEVIHGRSCGLWVQTCWVMKQATIPRPDHTSWGSQEGNWRSGKEQSNQERHEGQHLKSAWVDRGEGWVKGSTGCYHKHAKRSGS